MERKKERRSEKRKGQDLGNGLNVRKGKVEGRKAKKNRSQKR